MKYTKKQLTEFLEGIDDGVSAYEKLLTDTQRTDLDLAEIQSHIQLLEDMRCSVEGMLSVAEE